MKNYSIDLLGSIKRLTDGRKAYLAGSALLLIALGNLILVAGKCLKGDLDFTSCADQIGTFLEDLKTAALGLGIIGVRHAIAKK